MAARVFRFAFKVRSIRSNKKMPSANGTPKRENDSLKKSTGPAFQAGRVLCEARPLKFHSRKNEFRFSTFYRFAAFNSARAEVVALFDHHPIIRAGAANDSGRNEFLPDEPEIGEAH